MSALLCVTVDISFAHFPSLFSEFFSARFFLHTHLYVFLSWLHGSHFCFLPISDVTASRDLNDYVITEKWRDVEQALPGDTKILPIWMAWGSVQYEVCAYLLIVFLSICKKHTYT